MKKNILVILCVMVSMSSLAGCGYTTASALPERLKTIYVEPFKNKINYTSVTGRRNVYFPLLEVKVKDAVIDRFLFDGNLRPVDNPDSADLILKGALVEYQRNSLRYTDNDDVQEYRVQIVMKLELRDVQEDTVMWSYGRFIGEATYFVTGSQATTEDAAVEDAKVDLAKRIVERTIEDW